MMTKSEIISTTLDALLDRHSSSPESFEYIKGHDYSVYKSGDETIIWRTIVDSNNQTIYDPTSQQRTIVVIFDSEQSSIIVKMYNQCSMSRSALDGVQPDAIVESKQYFKALRSDYRKFRKLRQLISKHKEHKEAKDFLKKLSTAFPSALDKHIFGK
jgi:hypothetical protein